MPSHLVPKDKAKASHDEISFKEAWPISTVVGAESGLSRGQVGCRHKAWLAACWSISGQCLIAIPECPGRAVRNSLKGTLLAQTQIPDLNVDGHVTSRVVQVCLQSRPILVVNVRQYRHHSESFMSFSLFLLVWSCVHCPPEIRVWWHGQILEVWPEFENVACDLLRPLEFREISPTFLKLSTQHPWNTCYGYFRTWLYILYYFFLHLFHPCWSHLSLNDHVNKARRRALGVPVLFSSLEGSYHI